MGSCFVYQKRKSKAKWRLFCFSYAGSGASIFRDWAEGVGSECEVFPVQLPARENRIQEPSISNIHDLVTSLVSDFLPYLDLPFAFFGHSMGTLVAFELTRALCRQYRPTPCMLIVSAHRAPQIPYPAKRISHVPDAELWMEMYERYHAIPEEVFKNDEMRDLLLPALRADMTIEENYYFASEALLKCPIMIFAGEEDYTVSQEHLLAWNEQTSHPPSPITTFLGDHFYIHTSLDAVLARIKQLGLSIFDKSLPF